MLSRKALHLAFPPKYSAPLEWICRCKCLFYNGLWQVNIPSTEFCRCKWLFHNGLWHGNGQPTDCPADVVCLVVKEPNRAKIHGLMYRIERPESRGRIGPPGPMSPKGQHVHSEIARLRAGRFSRGSQLVDPGLSASSAALVGRRRQSAVWPRIDLNDVSAFPVTTYVMSPAI